MSERTTGIYWVPLALGAGLLLVSVPLTNLSPSIGARGNAIAIVAGTPSLTEAVAAQPGDPEEILSVVRAAAAATRR